MKLEKSQQSMLPTSQCDDVSGEVTKLEVTKNLAKKIVASGLQNDAFLLANEDQLMKNCGQLAKYFSEIQPYFGNYNINYVVMNRVFKSGVSGFGSCCLEKMG